MNRVRFDLKNIQVREIPLIVRRVRIPQQEVSQPNYLMFFAFSAIVLIALACYLYMPPLYQKPSPIKGVIINEAGAPIGHSDFTSAMPVKYYDSRYIDKPLLEGVQFAGSTLIGATPRSELNKYIYEQNEYIRNVNEEVKRINNLGSRDSLELQRVREIERQLANSVMR